MTYWLELLVDEELRDLVAEKLNVEIEETVENPFAAFPEIGWTDALHSNPHTAKFKTKDGEDHQGAVLGQNQPVHWATLRDSADNR